MLAAAEAAASENTIGPSGEAALSTFVADPSNWSVHEQATLIDQWHYGFNSPYAGTNSFDSGRDDERSFSSTLFLGRALWPGAELYYNPEILQGHGLGNTVGIAGFPNGEAGKAAFYQLHYNTSRLFIRETIGLGGETEKIDDGANQIAGARDVNRLTLSVGKFSANDFFDDNAYSHDPRGQFMNWSLWESAAWDFPADVLGYTAGIVAELNAKDWEIHYGTFMEPTEANGGTLDAHLAKAWGQILEFDRRYTLGGHSGTVRPFIFWNHADMGDYADALALPAGGVDVTKTRAYRSKVGAGLSWDQDLTQDLGAFVRLSWNDGRTETWAFTEIDRSIALGLALKGSGWKRPDDLLGVAVEAGGLSPEHRDYLAAGGLGMILGDGRLSYGAEEILESYYDLKVSKWLWLSPDFQYVEHPGDNRDRGGVAIYAVRAHVEF